MNMNALKQGASNHTDDSLVMLTVDQVVAAPWGNVRRGSRNNTKWTDFLADVRLRGIIQSVTVRPHPEVAGVFELLAGYGRWDAAKIVGCPLPALVVNCSDSEGVAIGMMENLQREDMGPVDEAHAAQTALALCNGDYEEARKQLGWSLGRLKQRLHLTRCTPAVLDAISAKLVSLRHADLLAGISAEAQNALLPSITEKSLSVDALKALLGKASAPISSARFDVGDCASCIHNSQQQSSLFNEFAVVDGAVCRNLVCFKQKTAAMVAARKGELAERYGTIIVLSEVSQGSINHVSHDTVGAEQMFDGCLPCSKRVALLDDRIDTAGDVLEDRCTDPDCFKTCVAKHCDAVAEAAEITEQANWAAGIDPALTNAAQPLQLDDGNKQAPNVPKRKAADSDPATSLSSSVVADHKIMLRRAAVEAWGSDAEASQRFQLSVVLSSLLSVAGKATFGRALPDTIADSSKSIEALRSEIASTMSFIVERLDGTGYCPMVDVMMATLPHAPNAKEKAIAQWVPTPERLKNYTTDTITFILKESGFLTAYEAAHDAKALKKLIGMNKGDLIKTVGSFEFSWSGYAPSFYFKGFE